MMARGSAPLAPRGLYELFASALGCPRRGQLRDMSSTLCEKRSPRPTMPASSFCFRHPRFIQQSRNRSTISECCVFRSQTGLTGSPDTARVHQFRAARKRQRSTGLGKECQAFANCVCRLALAHVLVLMEYYQAKRANSNAHLNRCQLLTNGVLLLLLAPSCGGRSPDV